MSDNTSLGDRMKAYEALTAALLPRRTYTILRVDGRAFHTYLRGADKPFDHQFMADMDAVAVALCTEISGAVLAYVHSDEVSILATDFATPTTQPWFGGVVQKMVSVAASVATAELGSRRDGRLIGGEQVLPFNTQADPKTPQVTGRESGARICGARVSRLLRRRSNLHNDRDRHAEHDHDAEAHHGDPCCRPPAESPSAPNGGRRPGRHWALRRLVWRPRHGLPFPELPDRAR